jgi:MYXO-CTERM domain-containing protein
MRSLYAFAVCALLTFPGGLHADLTNRYSFNDGTASDSVGSAHGTLVNGAAVQNGQLVFSPTVNTGFNSNPATGQYVDLPNTIARTRALTIEAWTTYRGGSNWQRIADFGNNSSGRELPPADKTTVGYLGIGFIILTPSNTFGHPIAQISVNSSGGGEDTDFVGATSPLPQNVEQHVVFSHDPDAGVDALYVNGVLWGQSTAEFDTVDTNYLNNWIGRSNFQQDAFYNGTINEFRIYDHGLTAAQVRANFALGPNVVPEPSFGLVGAAAAAGFTLLRRRRPTSLRRRMR